MDVCDFTGDSDMEFFIPTCYLSERRLNSVDSLSVVNYGGNNDDDVSLQSKRSRTEVTEAFCFPKARCAGLETSLSELFPPKYPRLKTPDPFSFLNEGTKGTTTHPTTQQRAETTVISPHDCCNHDEPVGSRRFLVQFDPSNVSASASLTDKCYAAEKSRCEEFWEFINSTPELNRIIRDGKFVHKTHPKGLHRCGVPLKEVAKKAATVRTSGVTKPRKYTVEMEALRRRNIAIHKENDQRRAKLHGRFVKLQEKSGQQTRSADQTSKQPKRQSQRSSSVTKKCFLVGCLDPSPSEMLEEMEIYDDLSGNPVGVSCKFKRRPSLRCEPQFVIPLDDLDAGEAMYYDGE